MLVNVGGRRKNERPHQRAIARSLRHHPGHSGSADWKAQRRWHSFNGTKRAAQIECARLISELQGGTYLEPNRLTLAKWLETWLSLIRPNVSPRTHERYTEIATKNLSPVLGAVILTKLTSTQVCAAYAGLLATGRRNGPGGLSARTVHHCHRVLNSALRRAVRDNLLVRNPADLDKKDRPKVERKAVATIDTDATVEVIGAARDRRLFVAVLLGSMTGLRRGEICALRWKSVDLDRGQLAVIASTEQTKAGTREKDAKGSKCRTLALPSLLVEELRRHRITQSEELLRAGIRVSGEGHVVTQADGQPLQPNSLTHAVTIFMKERGSTVRLHGLRHSHASHLLASNVHPKIVQERFGHSSVAITMDIYSHLMPNMQSDAVAKVDDVFRAAINKRS
jgi:integrase